MPDVETELGRFGRWLDTEIDVRVEDGAALALSAEPAVNSARRRGRLAAAIGVAVALAVGVLVVTSRGPLPALAFREHVVRAGGTPKFAGCEGRIGRRVPLLSSPGSLLGSGPGSCGSLTAT